MDHTISSLPWPSQLPRTSFRSPGSEDRITRQGPAVYGQPFRGGQWRVANETYLFSDSTLQETSVSYGLQGMNTHCERPITADADSHSRQLMSLSARYATSGRDRDRITQAMARSCYSPHWRKWSSPCGGSHMPVCLRVSMHDVRTSKHGRLCDMGELDESHKQRICALQA